MKPISKQVTNPENQSQLHLEPLKKKNKAVSHTVPFTISDINTASQINFIISKKFIICKHLENAWCWGLLQMQFQGLWVTIMSLYFGVEIHTNVSMIELSTI